MSKNLLSFDDEGSLPIHTADMNYKVNTFDVLLFLYACTETNI